MKRMMKKKKHGFTLIELIVVIAILGILATIAIPRVGAFRTQAQDAAIVATCRTIASAVTMSQAQNGATTTPTVAGLTDYLNDAAGLSADYTINYNAAAGHAGEITSVTFQAGGAGVARVWVIGSDVLSN